MRSYQRILHCVASEGKLHSPSRYVVMGMVIHPLHKAGLMRTNIIIDDSLMTEALQATGVKTKREVVELGLKTLVMLKQQEAIKALKGTLKWEGDLAGMRLDRCF